MGCLKTEKRGTRRGVAARVHHHTGVRCLWIRAYVPLLAALEAQGTGQKAVLSSLCSRLGFARVKPALFSAAPALLGYSLCEGRSGFAAALSRSGSWPSHDEGSCTSPLRTPMQLDVGPLVTQCQAPSQRQEARRRRAANARERFSRVGCPFCARRRHCARARCWHGFRR